MSQPTLAVGDRVVSSWPGVPDRNGVVVECYNGVPTSNRPGEKLAAVRWDDTGLVERGYFSQGGGLRRIAPTNEQA